MTKPSDSLAAALSEETGQLITANSEPGTALELNHIDFGHIHGSFYTPRIKQEFSSPLVNTDNFRLSGGDDAVLIERVIAGLKPIAFSCAPDPARIQKPVPRLIEAQRSYSFKQYIFRGGEGVSYHLSASLNSVIGELFDLEALEADYHAWYATDRSACHSVSLQVKRLRSRQLADFLEFSDVEVDLAGIMHGTVHPAGEYLRCGLLLGYPHQTTAALVGDKLGLAGFYQHTGMSKQQQESFKQLLDQLEDGKNDTA